MPRRGSFERSSFDRRLSDNSRTHAHRKSESVERGARIAETGSLIRGRQTAPSLIAASSSPATMLDRSESVMNHVELNA